ncbi:unnamed protein product [Amoebophrya sp. A120]|nr:unnamed protein product [Amoebophrya sp. A120]|eukprot:GSA120T00014491001.1
MIDVLFLTHHLQKNHTTKSCPNKSSAPPRPARSIVLRVVKTIFNPKQQQEAAVAPGLHLRPLAPGSSFYSEQLNVFPLSTTSLYYFREQDELLPVLPVRLTPVSPGRDKNLL